MAAEPFEEHSLSLQLRIEYPPKDDVLGFRKDKSATEHVGDTPLVGSILEKYCFGVLEADRE